jgi:LmbE family N-acetylglucosaminyl deacetylase
MTYTPMKRVLQTTFFFTVLYAVIIRLIHDFSVPRLAINDLLSSKKDKTSIAFVFPHPDDETMVSGGLIRQLTRDPRFIVHVLIVTRGEKGNELLGNDVTEEQIGEIRTDEFHDSMTELGVISFKQLDLGDGLVKVEKHSEDIEKYIESINPDWVVTFEKTGIYGHSDHVALSEIVYNLSQKHNFNTLYGTMPSKIERIANIGNHMRDDVNLVETSTCVQPTLRLPIFREMLSKYRAASKYKSQNLSHSRPLWMTVAAMPYEYYTTEWEPIN